jgi:DNA helicase-2/ATP-dependent DNA helicase PcrA
MIDLLANLNPQQRLAVEHGKGPALVLAGAGSGKTRVIVHRIAHLIRNEASRPENILAVTFTNKAAQEMRERVHGLLGPSRIAEPLVSTFHSLCVRILRHDIHLLGYKRDFSIYDSDDQRRLMRQILADFKEVGDELSVREVLSRISYAKSHDIPPEAYANTFRFPISEDIQEIYTRYDQRLQRSNALDFDDLLLKTVELLAKDPNRNKSYSDWFRFILVDEYQDTNRPQYRLLKNLTSQHQNLFVVGDEDQSIYKFRGANIQNILNFERDFAGTRTIKLEQNYRSSQNILRVANSVVQHNIERKGKALWTENRDGEIVKCYRASSARIEAAWVTAKIQALLDEDSDCHVAILYRANSLSRNFEDALRQAEIPYVVVGSVSFFNRLEVKDMLAYLRVIFNPEDDVALLRIINTPARGIGSTTIDELTQEALEKGTPISEALRERVLNPEASGRASRPLARFQSLLDSWTAQRDTLDLAHMLAKVMEDTQYIAMLEKLGTDEETQSRRANIEELMRAATESQERGETAFEFLDRASLSSELDEFDEEARVALLTLHSAKGLEFDIVFLAGLEEGLCPHSQSMNSLADLEEERRLCYVGITRARQKLFLTWTPYRRAFGSNAGMPSLPSRFLGEIPLELLEGHDDSGSTYIREEDSDYMPTWREIASLSATRQKTMPSRMQSPFRSPAPAPSAVNCKEGMRVRHAQFGDGIVLRREKLGTEVKVTVTFSRVGKKTLIEKYAKLVPI